MQPDPNDNMKPRPMPQPRVLYRSVSLPELVDIWRSGVVAGGGNIFNFMDQRRYVFFADELDERLMRYGEFVDSQAHYDLRDHVVSRRSEQTLNRIEQIADVILAEMDHDRIPYDVALADEFRFGWERRRFRSAVFTCEGVDRPKYAALFRIFSRLQREFTALDGEYGRQHQLSCAEIERRLTRSPYSSAVIVTHPIAGGLLYSTEFGFSGHGEREYAFRPGQITVSDIFEIILIKAGREVERCSPPGLGRRLALQNWEQPERHASGTALGQQKGLSPPRESLKQMFPELNTVPGAPPPPRGFVVR